MIEESDLDDLNVENRRRHRSLSWWLGKTKHYYDRYNGRYFAPVLLLFVYSILGAWFFYILEHEKEKRLKIEEAWDLDRLRKKAFHRIVGIFHTRQGSQRMVGTRNVLLWYENELQRVRLPDALEWDMWGALFYVGTILTTIGYGNIFPRTVAGRALSVVYAIIGIPLVLAILAKFGHFLEQAIARAWLRHGENIKKAHKQSIIRLIDSMQPNFNSLPRLEEAKLLPSVKSDFLEDKHKSKTIPVWLALLICLSWICVCAGLFLIWEKRWSFFTSLYFFFISLSTIGLGDVIPDHPHMLILMFWLVIIGLSIVSMLLTVIQIKFEEWLYNFIKRIQEEYQRDLAEGQHPDRNQIRERAMRDQPLLMKLFGMDLISDQQMEKIDEKSKKYERIMSSTNNKNIQTELPLFVIPGTPQMENTTNIVVYEPVSEPHSHIQEKTQRSRSISSMVNEECLSDKREANDDSSSDIASLPLDTLSAKSVNELRPDTTFKLQVPQLHVGTFYPHFKSLQDLTVNKPSIDMASYRRIQSIEKFMDYISDWISDFDIPVPSTRSQQTSHDTASQTTAKRCTEFTSRGVGGVDESGSCNLGADCCLHGSFCNQVINRTEISTQYSPPTSQLDISRLGIINKKILSSISKAGGAIKKDKYRKLQVQTKDVVVQTDNSYLKIAHRLEEYRSIRSQFLPVFAMMPLHLSQRSSNIEPTTEQSGPYIDMDDIQQQPAITNVRPKLKKRSSIVSLDRHSSIDQQVEQIESEELDVYQESYEEDDYRGRL